MHKMKKTGKKINLPSAICKITRMLTENPKNRRRINEKKKIKTKFLSNLMKTLTQQIHKTQ